MTTPELLPCPFCGGEAYLRDDVSHSTAYFIGCSTQDCFGEIHWGQTEAEAVTGWNTRAPLSPAVLAELPEVTALVAAERERCAKIADPPLMHRKGKPGLWRTRRAAIAAAIMEARNV